MKWTSLLQGIAAHDALHKSAPCSGFFRNININRFRTSKNSLDLGRRSQFHQHKQAMLSTYTSLSGSLLALQPSSEPPSLYLLIAIAFGLPSALWLYKCIAMVLLQRKIIYMGYAPPGARQEALSKILKSLSPKLLYEEARISSSDKVSLQALIIMAKRVREKPDCVLVYLQGNAGNPLHRIPVFEELLIASSNIFPVIVAAAPRAYWRSTNKTPTQRGILADYRSTLRFVTEKWPGVPVVLYGHSLGGAVAVSLLASLGVEAEEGSARIMGSIRGLILENPFSSIPDMVRALYPQKWLPYRFLAPLAWDKWDALAALQDTRMTAVNNAEASDASNSESSPGGLLRRVAKDMLVLVSARDEVVPREMGRALYDARPPGGSARFVVIDDALHENAWRQKQWAREVVAYLDRIKS